MIRLEVDEFELCSVLATAAGSLREMRELAQRDPRDPSYTRIVNNRTRNWNKLAVAFNEKVTCVEPFEVFDLLG